MNPHTFPFLETTVGRALAAAVAVILPTECVGCGARDRALCAVCSETIGASPPPSAAPSPASAWQSSPGARSCELVIEALQEPPLRVWAGVPYGTVVSSALSAFKEAGRTDAARPLARVLESSILDARTDLEGRLPPGAVLELTVAPSSRAAFRRRGYHPVELLAVRARGALPIARTLRVARPVADQAGLGREARRANLNGSLEVRSKLSGALDGRHFLVVDDVTTTGSTLVECRRALESVGATVWGAATLAYTPKHHGASTVRPVGEREGQMG
ncbi:ComF family protein [Subtercola boreus]|nr:phosphoribosyltransferase family protein [Subtercola boreus]